MIDWLIGCRWSVAGWRRLRTWSGWRDRSRRTRSSGPCRPGSSTTSTRYTGGGRGGTRGYTGIHGVGRVLRTLKRHKSIRLILFILEFLNPTLLLDHYYCTNISVHCTPTNLFHKAIFFLHWNWKSSLKYRFIKNCHMDP